MSGRRQYDSSLTSKDDYKYRKRCKSPCRKRDKCCEDFCCEFDDCCNFGNFQCAQNFCPQQQCCNFQVVCAEACDVSTGKKSKLKVKIPQSLPVYVTANRTGTAQTLAAAGTVIFNTLVGVPSDSMVYNVGTGIFTVPVCGDGVYNINTNIIAGVTGTADIFIVANNIQVAQATIFGGNQSVSLSVDVPLLAGQSVSILAVPTAGSTIDIFTGSTLSIARVSDIRTINGFACQQFGSFGGFCC